ncbi:MAG: lipid-A-disaccharide synthase [Candidatus Devosia phytovorans]|uniref:Lipid-A-disaccharide synthase n=1 Tax=Candidatus Devosia phytovorans TaxID=3121372 RepID=A0AAJ5VYM4_9HYPH|nr:lipid-A-disaccharide synthase [Devosia sp.]WEK05928.1 MAG: lipid-A-disaccharide synthase [Devosia sp.]
MSEPDRLRLFILAGEPSGDRIAADLIRRLKARVHLGFIGVGGQEMQAEGLKSLFPMSDLAVMGITDVLMRLPLLLWRVEQTARTIRKANPDIVVLVDSQDFSKLVAKRAKKLGHKGKLILYVAPTVWARAPQRAARLKPLFEEVLAVLPFEPAVMTELGGPQTHYVGHPALGERIVRDSSDRGPLVLLPGSRDGELRRHLPLFRQVVEQIGTHPAVDGVVIPTLSALKPRIERETADWPVPVTVVADRAARGELYRYALMALAVSGTATLELALAQVPMVVSYVLDGPQAKAYDKLGRPPVSLPNIILDRPLVQELVQSAPDAAALTAAVRELLDSKKARQDQIVAFGELGDLMEQGAEGHPRQDPADRVLSHWDQRTLIGS